MLSNFLVCLGAASYSTEPVCFLEWPVVTTYPPSINCSLVKEQSNPLCSRVHRNDLADLLSWKSIRKSHCPDCLFHWLSFLILMKSSSKDEVGKLLLVAAFLSELSDTEAVVQFL